MHSFLHFFRVSKNRLYFHSGVENGQIKNALRETQQTTATAQQPSRLKCFQIALKRDIEFQPVHFLAIFFPNGPLENQHWSIFWGILAKTGTYFFCTCKRWHRHWEAAEIHPPWHPIGVVSTGSAPSAFACKLLNIVSIAYHKTARYSSVSISSSPSYTSIFML